LFRILKACYHENSRSSSFEFKSSNYFILDHSNIIIGLSVLSDVVCYFSDTSPPLICDFLWKLSIYCGYLETRMIGFDRNQKILMMD